MSKLPQDPGRCLGIRSAVGNSKLKFLGRANTAMVAANGIAVYTHECKRSSKFDHESHEKHETSSGLTTLLAPV